MQLSRETCVPCRGGQGALAPGAVQELLRELPGWSLQDGGKQIGRQFSFADFKQAMGFVNRMADVAEAEGHHPDFTVHYKNVVVSLSTHDVGGLSRNDFILAAKIDELSAAGKPTDRA